MRHRDPQARRKTPEVVDSGGLSCDLYAISILPSPALSEQVSQAPAHGHGERRPISSDNATAVTCVDMRGFAQLVNVSVRSLTRADAQGLLPAADLAIGRARRWTYETIRKWLATRPRLLGRGRRGVRHGQ
jgi:hypothetical protein